MRQKLWDQRLVGPRPKGPTAAASRKAERVDTPQLEMEFIEKFSAALGMGPRIGLGRGGRRPGASLSGVRPREQQPSPLSASSSRRD